MTTDIESLLAEAPWLARLARSLTGSAADADDIVQDTYATALRSPPSTARPVRPWLRMVAVNLVRMRHRGRARRGANETAAEIQVEPVRTPEQLLERAELEQRLAELVIGLDEPFRSTVLLRYREGLSAEEIGSQLGIPAATVRSRLKTGLDRLRRELDDGEQRRMRAVFPPLIPGLWRRLIMVKVTSKVLAMVAILVLALIMGGALLFMDHRDRGAGTSAPPLARAPSTASAAQIVERAAMFAQPGVARRHVRGRVTAEGAPFRGASVQLVHKQTSVVLAEVTSAADGTFDLGERNPDAYVVAASAPERIAAPVTVDLRAPALAEVELALSGCSHVRGTVVDGSGAPIAHARVARDIAPTPFAETDGNGHYDLCTHFGGTTVRFSASGYQQYIVVVDATPVSTRDVVLIPEATVEGKVLAADDTPVEGAWVMIDPGMIGFGGGNAAATGFTAADGSFRIVGVSPGRNLLSAFAEARRTARSQELVVGAGQAISGVVLRLEATATLRGVVVSGGVPVPGVGVGIRRGNLDELGVAAVTQPDGSFVIDRAPRGDLAIYVVDHVVVSPRSVRAGEGLPAVTIHVRSMATVRGRVLRGGTPVAGALVGCPNASAFTDRDGTYRCTGVGDGPLDLYAYLPSGEWGRGSVSIVDGTSAQLDIAIAFNGVICGRTIDQQGAPVPGLRVQVAERTTGDFGKDTTAVDGSFCARMLTGGTYDVTVRTGVGRVIAPLAPLTPVMIGPRDTANVTISVAAPRLAISGIVRDPDGAPVVDAVVRTAPADLVGTPDFPSIESGRLWVTDEEGRFTLSGLAAGDYMVSVTARDGSAVRRTGIAAGTRDLAITVAAAGAIDGTLVGFASPPRITLALSSFALVDIGQPLGEAVVDGAHFHVSGLSPGGYVLTALTDGREGDAQKIIVRPGTPTPVTMTSRGTATVIGTVRDFVTRTPIAGMGCAPFPRTGDAVGTIFNGPDQGVATDARGVFRMPTPAGELNILCIGAGRACSRNITATRDGTTTVDLFSVPGAPNPGSINAELEYMRPRIKTIAPGGAADTAGLVVGDEIIAVDGASITELDPASTMQLINQRPAGAKATLTILRGSERRSIAVTVRGANQE